MRHIKEIEKLPISDLTDEEILKCTVKRLNTKAAILIYEDEGNITSLWRYKKTGYPYLTQVKKVLENAFGKFKSIEKD